MPIDFEILAYEESPLGMICLRRRALPSDPDTVVTEITLDHEFLMSSFNVASEVALARSALAMHTGSELRVLVGGLGLGYTAHAALQSDRVASVDVVELLPQVIDWLERELVPLGTELKRDERLDVRCGDVYRQLAAAPAEGTGLYDLVLVDVDHSPDERLGESNASFYTRDGLARVKRHLAPQGVLGVWSYAESSPFADALRESFAEVRVEEVSFDNPVVGEAETNWLFFARD